MSPVADPLVHGHAKAFGAETKAVCLAHTAIGGILRGQRERLQVSRPIGQGNEAPGHLRDNVEAVPLAPQQAAYQARNVTETRKLAGVVAFKFAPVLLAEPTQFALLGAGIIVNEQGDVGIQPAPRLQMKVNVRHRGERTHDQPDGHGWRENGLGTLEHLGDPKLTTRRQDPKVPFHALDVFPLRVQIVASQDGILGMHIVMRFRR